MWGLSSLAAWLGSWLELLGFRGRTAKLVGRWISLETAFTGSRSVSNREKLNPFFQDIDLAKTDLDLVVIGSGSRSSNNRSWIRFYQI